jgi:hypothetical protein
MEHLLQLVLAKGDCFVTAAWGSLSVAVAMLGSLLFFWLLKKVFRAKSGNLANSIIREISSKWLGFWDMVLGVTLISVAGYSSELVYLARGGTDVLLWLLSFGLGCLFGYIYLWLVSNATYLKKYQPLSLGAIIFSLVFTSCYGHYWGWLILATIGPFVIFLLIIVAFIYCDDSPANRRQED